MHLNPNISYTNINGNQPNTPTPAISIVPTTPLPTP